MEALPTIALPTANGNAARTVPSSRRRDRCQRAGGQQPDRQGHTTPASAQQLRAPSSRVFDGADRHCNWSAALVVFLQVAEHDRAAVLRVAAAPRRSNGTRSGSSLPAGHPGQIEVVLFGRPSAEGVFAETRRATP